MGGRGSSGGGVSAKMPELTGSAKQISYANELRRKTLSALKSAEKEMMKIAPNEQAKENARKNIDYMRTELKNMTSAAELIDTLGKAKISGKNAQNDFGEIAAAFRARMRGTFKYRRY